MKGDFDTLAQLGEVYWMSSRVGRGWRRVLGPTGWLPSSEMLRLVHGCDLVFQWFACPSAPVVAAQLLRKPSLVVAGGYDVAAVPKIGYGQMLNRRTRWMARITLGGATRVLCVSHSTLEEVNRWAPTARAVVVYHGFDPHRFPLGLQKRRQVVTVGSIRWDYLERKGLATFARTSRLLPSVRFVVAGRIVHPEAAQNLKELGGDNLILVGFLPESELTALLRESAVYAQLSLHEGFGCAVAEGMLSGCTPVTTPCGALPEVVGSCGYVVPPGDAGAAAATIERALAEPSGPRARARVVAEFPTERRNQLLSAEVLTLTARSHSN